MPAFTNVKESNVISPQVVSNSHLRGASKYMMEPSSPKRVILPRVRNIVLPTLYVPAGKNIVLPWGTVSVSLIKSLIVRALFVVLSPTIPWFVTLIWPDVSRGWRIMTK